MSVTYNIYFLLIKNLNRIKLNELFLEMLIVYEQKLQLFCFFLIYIYLNLHENYPFLFKIL